MIKNLSNLFEVFKPSDNALDGRFIKMKDSDGWTNGYIADLTDLHRPTMEAKARLRGIDVTEKADGPIIKSAIPEGKEEHEVETIEYDLGKKAVRLINTTLEAHVNPKYLQYFQKAYAELGGIEKLTITGNNEPVRVYTRNKMLAGVIMPIRT